MFRSRTNPRVALVIGLAAAGTVVALAQTPPQPSPWIGQGSKGAVIAGPAPTQVAPSTAGPTTLPSAPASSLATEAQPLPTPTPIDSGAGSSKPTSPELLSSYAVLMDTSSGKILWSRNPNVKREIASTTKIMTAILLLERGKLEDLVTGPPGIDKAPESSLHLKPGETITLHDLLYAMLLRSANDTAIAGADYLDGSVPAFAADMTKKAHDIGAVNTNFVTPNGLYDPKHYSTAADMALIARYAVLNLPLFNEIVKTQTYKVQRSMDKNDEWVKNTSSKFLKEFPGADGIKTGFISQAGHCFIGSATRHGWRLITVVLDSYKCREDAESILNYGFDNYRRIELMPGNASVGQIAVPNATAPVPVQTATDVVTAVSRWKPMPHFSYKLMPLAALPAAPVAAGEKLGVVTVVADGVVQARVDAVAAASVAARPQPFLHLAGPAKGGGLAAGIMGAMVLLGATILGGLYARTVAKGSGGSRDSIAPPLRRAD